MFIVPIVFGAIGHFVGAAMLGGTGAEEAFITGSLPRFLLPMPIDYAGGSLMGVAFGLGLFRSFVHPEDDEQRTAAGTD